MLAKLTPGREISTHAPAGGATGISGHALSGQKFLLTPLREGRQAVPVRLSEREDFYSRPCGRGDDPRICEVWHCPNFYSRPCGRGDPARPFCGSCSADFYSRPCGRGDRCCDILLSRFVLYFYSRPCGRGDIRLAHIQPQDLHFYSRPCGRGDVPGLFFYSRAYVFLLTPLREGRPAWSTNCTRTLSFLLTPLREGRLPTSQKNKFGILISTHAPAGGATAIFHKSVMRFCGKLPKDDTVLCLASFGFPRRDPKAVYLAWISCANLPQKCVRQGLALKDQGTSCFHEGLASHAFVPVLV